MKEREELRLCTDFGELRAGMLVEIWDCDDGCGKHRGVLVAIEATEFYLVGDPDLLGDPEPGWILEPPGRCCGPDDNLCIAADHVDEGRVYIVDARNDDEAEQAQGKLDESIRDSRRVRYEDVK